MVVVSLGLDHEGTVSDFVFCRDLRAVEAPSGRRVVPLKVIEEWDHRQNAGAGMPN